MTGVDFPVIGAAKTIWDMLIGLLKSSADDKKSFLEQHVEPLQAKLIEVHQDYIATFQQVQKHLRDSSRPPSYLIDFLSERRRSYLYEHRLVMDLAAEVGHPDNARFRGRKLKAAVTNYSSAVSEYFGVTQYISYPSWYTDFLNIVKRNLDSRSVDAWETEAISENPRKYLLRLVDQILDRQLPQAFGRVSESYAKLKICLV